MDNNIIEGITDGLVKQMQTAIVKTQIKLHEELQRELTSTIRNMGFNMDLKETRDLHNKILCNINFCIPKIKGITDG